jgi:hypothetical protein
MTIRNPYVRAGIGLSVQFLLVCVYLNREALDKYLGRFLIQGNPEHIQKRQLIEDAYKHVKDNDIEPKGPL